VEEVFWGPRSAEALDVPVEVVAAGLAEWMLLVWACGSLTVEKIGLGRELVLWKRKKQQHAILKQRLCLAEPGDAVLEAWVASWLLWNGHQSRI
jgi:hypothetical protein